MAKIHKVRTAVLESEDVVEALVSAARREIGEVDVLHTTIRMIDQGDDTDLPSFEVVFEDSNP